MKIKILNRTEGGYIYDKRIFWGAMGFVMLIGFWIMWGQGFDFSPKFHFKCDYPEPCENPLITGRCRIGFRSGSCADMCKEEWCKQEILPVGEYGQKKPDGLIKYYPYITVLILIASLFFNHYVHNKGRRFEAMISLPESWKRRAKKFMEGLEDE